MPPVNIQEFCPYNFEFGIQGIRDDAFVAFLRLCWTFSHFHILISLRITSRQLVLKHWELEFEVICFGSCTSTVISCKMVEVTALGWLCKATLLYSCLAYIAMALALTCRADAAVDRGRRRSTKGRSPHPSVHAS